MKCFVVAAVFALANLLVSTSAMAQGRPFPEGYEAPPTGPVYYPPLVLPNVNATSNGNRPRVAREDRVLKKGLLAPSEGDRMALAAFLRTENTGLIRLLPRERNDSGTYRVPKKLNIRGGGAYYSFVDLTHEYGYGSDIELHRNNLTVGFAGADYGMLTNIGDTPLDEITLHDMRTRNIAAYRPTRSEPEAREIYQRLNSGPGMMFDGFLYRRRVPVQENSTYLLRSISYRTSDVLVALRLVRQDTDGSVIIAWKLLKSYSIPRLSGDHR
jgi:hypothetical protein